MSDYAKGQALAAQLTLIPRSDAERKRLLERMDTTCVLLETMENDAHRLGQSSDELALRRARDIVRRMEEAIADEV
jgi:hypothetical protein